MPSEAAAAAFSEAGTGGGVANPDRVLPDVMRGLGPRIHVFREKRKNVDGRDKPGHDDG